MRLKRAAQVATIGTAVAFGGLAVGVSIGHPQPQPAAQVVHASPSDPMVAVHAEADGGSALVGNFATSTLRIVCGYGTADGWQVVETADGQHSGYAIVSDARCPR